MAWQGYVLAVFATLIIGVATRRWASPGRPPGADEFDIPTAQDGRIIGVLFGRREIANYNTVWHGDIRSMAYQERERAFRRPPNRTLYLRNQQSIREAALGLDD